MKRFATPAPMLAALLFTFVALDAGTCSAGSGTVTDDTFHDECVRTYDPVLVEFQASYCPACRKMAGVVEELASEYAGKMKVLKMDTQSNRETPAQYNIRYIPTFVYMKDGYEVSRVSGAMSKDELKRRLGLP